MRQLLLVLITLSIIFIAALSIYINNYRFEVHFRVINLINSHDAPEIVYDYFTLPYKIEYGFSSEYKTLPRGKTDIHLSLIFQDGESYEFDPLTLSSDSLNTLIIIPVDDDMIVHQAITPRSLPNNQTALRYLNARPHDENVKVTIVNSDVNYVISTGEGFDSKYKLLTEGSYVIIIEINREEFFYRGFLEAGEIYTLSILQQDHTGIPSLRLFVDNFPGDQYITPRLYPTQ